MITVKIILAVAALCYLIATILLHVGLVKEGYAVGGVGWLLSIIIVIVNWVINGYAPFVSMYQVLTFLAACFPLTYLYVAFIKNIKWAAKYFCLTTAVVLIGVVCMDASLVWHFPPALQSPYFIPHVFSYMLSYSLCAVAFVLTIFNMIVGRNNGTEGIYENKWGEKINIERGIYTITLTAFPFMVLGLFLGALWANECWGNYWAWDAKETWSLVTMCLYALYFHIRKVPLLKKAANIILIVAFVALLMTFIGVSIFGSGGNHNYS